MREFKKRLGEMVRRALHRRGYRISRIGRFDFFQLLLSAYLRNNQSLFFVQIGANDGKSFDPIYEFVTMNHERVRGVAIEPVNDYFEQLKVSYRNYPNVITRNVAIHNTRKRMTIHRVDPSRIRQDDLPKWAKGIASFDENHHELSGIPADAIIRENVQCVSLNDLVKAHQIGTIDLLQIDTEGYDREIMLNIDFDIIKPKIIHFEHGLSAGIMTKKEFSNIADLLHHKGYELWFDLHDATAYQRNVLINF